MKSFCVTPLVFVSPFLHRQNLFYKFIYLSATTQPKDTAIVLRFILNTKVMLKNLKIV